MPRESPENTNWRAGALYVSTNSSEIRAGALECSPFQAQKPTCVFRSPFLFLMSCLCFYFNRAPRTIVCPVTQEPGCFSVALRALTLPVTLGAAGMQDTQTQ